MRRAQVLRKRRWACVSKRAADVSICTIALFLLAPAMALIAIVIWLTSGKPVLIRQHRVGRDGRIFPIYKFRSLPAEALTESDDRWSVTPANEWSALLRAMGLDELPQLWNVLRGDMSLVGPRPERPRFVEQFSRLYPAYGSRHALRPGITGWAQVHGSRGDTSIERRIEYDLFYLQHWSLKLDLRILFMTLTTVLHQLRLALASRREVSDVRSV